MLAFHFVTTGDITCRIFARRRADRTPPRPEDFGVAKGTASLTAAAAAGFILGNVRNLDQIYQIYRDWKADD
jgi:hypothetical protein